MKKIQTDKQKRVLARVTAAKLQNVAGGFWNTWTHGGPDIDFDEDGKQS